jgi:hypothetical protein
MEIIKAEKADIIVVILTDTTLPIVSLIRPKITDPIGRAATEILNIIKKFSNLSLFEPSGIK